MTIAKEIDYFVTEMGSVYKNVSGNGRGQRYQRFKTVENKQYAPWDMTVFVPTLANLSKENHLWVEKFENEEEFSNTVESMVYSKNIASYVGDENRKPLINNHHVFETLLSGGKVYMFLVDMDKKVEKRIPVSLIPELGYSPFETTLTEGGGKKIPKIHLGHKIVKIVEKR